MKLSEQRKQIEAKEKAILEELKKIKNPIISGDREPTEEEEQEIQTLREHLKNYEEIKRVFLQPEKDDCN